MTIFYFTATGNSLSVAKAIGGNLISIPQLIDQSDPFFEDDVIGLVFPIYGFGPPEMVRRFMEKVRWSAKYAFAIGTYGNLPGAAMRTIQSIAKRRGIPFDYCASIVMLDNYLPNFDITKQIASLPKKRVGDRITALRADIAARKSRPPHHALGWRTISATLQLIRPLAFSPKSAQRFLVEPSCSGCGVCAKVCPAANIHPANPIPHFGDQCQWCFACLHACPQNALYLKSQRSTARWRNPHTSLQELIRSNHRG